MKKILGLSLALFMLSGCTQSFEELNKDPYGIDEKIQSTIPIGVDKIQGMTRYATNDQENSWQHTNDLPAGASGYVSATGFVTDFNVYNPQDGYNDYPYDDALKHLYIEDGYQEIKTKTKADYHKPIFVLAHMNRVLVSLRLTDMYGPIAYSHIDGVATSVPYDSQRDVYLRLLEELKELSETIDDTFDEGERSGVEKHDGIFKGNMRSWARFARSLMLRMAVRMAKQEPDLAKTYAEYAVSRGLIASNDDNAKRPTTDNPAYKANLNWGDSAISADIVEYLKTFQDPRLSKYLLPAKNREGYFGYRNGSPHNIKKDEAKRKSYSAPNIKVDSPITLMNAAEVKFLMAEGVLNGWNMGGATAQALYEEGIKLSCAEWGITDFPESYLSNTNKRGAYTDTVFPDLSLPSFKSNITVSWADAGGDREKQLSKIITQKWIALFLYNPIEAWTEWRRTGYPNLMPILDNQSSGKVQDITQDELGRDRGGMRRLRFTSKEKSTVPEEIAKAVVLLGGPDTHGTDLWWAK